MRRGRAPFLHPPLTSFFLQDTPGVLARSVLDAAMVLDVIVGPDSKDSTCIPAGSRSGGDGFASGLLDAAAAAEGSAWPLEGVTVGIPKEFNVEELGKMYARPARPAGVALAFAWNRGLEPCIASAAAVSQDIPHATVAFDATTPTETSRLGGYLPRVLYWSFVDLHLSPPAAKDDSSSNNQCTRFPSNRLLVCVSLPSSPSGADAGVREAWEHTARTATALGATVVEVSMPSVPQVRQSFCVHACIPRSSKGDTQDLAGVFLQNPILLRRTRCQHAPNGTVCAVGMLWKVPCFQYLPLLFGAC